MLEQYGMGFRYGYLHGRGHEQNEAERNAVLDNYRPAPNPRELLELVSVRVLRPFCVAGKRVDVGASVELPRHDAISLQALGKVEAIGKAEVKK